MAERDRCVKRGGVWKAGHVLDNPPSGCYSQNQSEAGRFACFVEEAVGLP
jgi:hypothetical protein